MSAHLSFIKKTVGATKGSRPRRILKDDFSKETLAGELEEEIEEAVRKSQEEIQGADLNVEKDTKEEEEADEETDAWSARMRRMGNEMEMRVKQLRRNKLL